MFAEQISMNQYIKTPQLGAIEQLMKLQDSTHFSSTPADLTAEECIHQEMQKKGITFIHLNASPGSGKVSLLLATIYYLADLLNIKLLVQEFTSIKNITRFQNLQITLAKVKTPKAHESEAQVIWQTIQRMDLENTDLLFFLSLNDGQRQAHIGEDCRVTLLATTEGDDKPQQYPHLFLAYDLMLISKSDLIPYLPFSIEAVKRDAQVINPALQIIPISARSGEGMSTWCQWLLNKIQRTIS